MNPRFEHLPFLVLRNIFSYFTERELRENIQPVCQQWKIAAEDPELWKTIRACGIHTPLPLICDKVRQYNRVRTISIWASTDTNIIARQIARCSIHLTHLVLRHCLGFSEDTLRYLIAVCKSLKSLDLKGTPFRGLIVYEELAMTKVTNINLSGNIYLTVPNINTIVMNCRSIEGLHLSQFKSPRGETLDNTRCYFIIYSRWQNLKSLSLDCGSLSSGIYPSIFKCRYLQYLSLNYATALQGEDFEQLWKYLNDLKVLKVRFTHQIQGRHVKELFESGKDVLSNLVTLDFAGCTQLDDEGIEAVAKCCTKLKTLVLRSCKKVTDIGIVLENCLQLEVLNVAFCHAIEFQQLKIDHAVLKVLFISKHKNLERLVEQVNRISPSTIIKVCMSEFNKTVGPLQ